jgi:hypothetical protein
VRIGMGAGEKLIGTTCSSNINTTGTEKIQSFLSEGFFFSEEKKQTLSPQLQSLGKSPW